MRIDKFLQVSRILKRRSVAKEIIDKGRVKINDKVAKPGSALVVDDVIDITFGDYVIVLKVLKLDDKIKKDQASDLYEIIEKRELQ